jgi:hypothetical protein
MSSPHLISNKKSEDFRRGAFEDAETFGGGSRRAIPVGGKFAGLKNL